jgi:hypothetical protein
MALSLCLKQLVWLQGAITELRISSDIPTAIMCNNQSTIDDANDVKISNKTKHINMHYHSVREQVMRGLDYTLHANKRKSCRHLHKGIANGYPQFSP